MIDGIGASEVIDGDLKFQFKESIASSPDVIKPGDAVRRETSEAPQWAAVAAVAELQDNFDEKNSQVVFVIPKGCTRLQIWHHSIIDGSILCVHTHIEPRRIFLLHEL